jgi:pyruvate-ferredoxin/flavodoxin oxidoreductase
MQLDSKEPSIKIEDYIYNETRYRMLVQSDEARAEMLIQEAREDVDRRWQTYSQMASASYKKEE